MRTVRDVIVYPDKKFSITTRNYITTEEKVFNLISKGRNSIIGMDVAIGSTCNNSCRWCYHKDNMPIKYNFSKLLELLKKDIEQLDISKVYILSNNKSDPFSEVDQLKRIVECVNKINKNTKICILTNGTYPYEEVFENESIQLSVSVDGPPIVHDYNRGAGKYKKSLEFISKIPQWQTVWIETILSKRLIPYLFDHIGSFRRENMIVVLQEMIGNPEEHIALDVAEKLLITQGYREVA